MTIFTAFAAGVSVDPATASSGVPYLLAAASPNTSVTGTTDETTLATVTIPANAIGANGTVEIYAVYSYTNSANSKTLRIRFGGTSGTAYFNTASTTTANFRTNFTIANANSTNAQVGGSPAGLIAASSTAASTSSVDTTAPVDIVFRGLLANSSETITLVHYWVRVTRVP